MATRIVRQYLESSFISLRDSRRARITIRYLLRHHLARPAFDQPHAGYNLPLPDLPCYRGQQSQDLFRYQLARPNFDQPHNGCELPLQGLPLPDLPCYRGRQSQVGQTRRW